MRTAVLTFVMLPFYGIVKIWFLCRNFVEKYSASTTTSPEIHARKVKGVQDQVLEWIRNGRKNKMCTARPVGMSISFRRPTYKSSMTQINVDLGKVISLDTDRRTITVEPMMDMGMLSSYLLERGWIIPVVPELNELTVGGLICGAGIETSSHKYGLFQSICLSHEVVLPDGQLVTCSKTENSELFYSIPWSHGTLGFLTATTLMIIPAKEYMKLQYIPVRSLDEAVQVFTFQTLRESGNDYVEGIMFGLDKGVVMIGNMTAESETGKVNSILKWYKPWFYKHVETYLQKSSSGTYVEYIPLHDYFQRHDKGCFWALEFPFKFANNVLYRYFLGWILPIPPQFFLSLPSFCKDLLNRKHVLQDFLLPLNRLEESLIFVDKETHVYPIWLCPIKPPNSPGFLQSGSKERMFVDIGIYGMTKLKSYEAEKTGKRLEAFCLENGGYQALYADVFLTREQFQSMFDHELYFKLRKQLGCEAAFPEVYDKVRRAARR